MPDILRKAGGSICVIKAVSSKTRFLFIHKIFKLQGPNVFFILKIDTLEIYDDQFSRYYFILRHLK